MQHSAELHGLYAHTPATPKGPWHGLHVHLFSVANLASAFGEKWGAGDCCFALGLAHDLGKADPAFQHYLRDSQEGKVAEKCPHAYAGAVAAYPHLKTFALAVAGHHTGMPNKSDWKTDIVPKASPDTVKAAMGLFEELGKRYQVSINVPEWATTDQLTAEMFIRMSFSCLVDADRLDTEAHFQSGKATARGQFPPLYWYRDRLKGHQCKFGNADGPVNSVRREVLDSCRAAAASESGVFTLTVPTGGGKTLSGLAFALEHALQHGKSRIVVAIPYTSIIDQTAMVYGSIFGEQNLLEHHSSVEWDDDESTSEVAMRRRLATENWDCPLIVTTTVQLFESLLSNRPSKCRKLHNLANSIIIVDEVQALPEKCLGPILDVLHQLASQYGATVVLSTATPPDYSPVDSRLLNAAAEIVPDYERHFASLKRVVFEFPSEEWDVVRLREELQEEEQALVVLNSRKDAIEIARACEGLDGLFHLSTLLCGHHRKAVLANVHQRLEDKKPVRVISTQVVEAGVDLDFPKVYRAIGPLDRIVQAAGRCNRGGNLPGLGKCVVFKMEGARAPNGPYATGTALTGPILAKFGQRVAHPEATRCYTRKLYARTETGSTASPGDRAVIQKLRADLAFRSVAETFRMIDQDTVPVIVESYCEELPELIASWHTRPVGWFRRIAPYTVNLYRGEALRLQGAGIVRPHESGAMICSGPYHPLFGIGAKTPDPSDLIA